MEDLTLFFVALVGAILIAIVYSVISGLVEDSKYNERKKRGVCPSCGGEGKIKSGFMNGPDVEMVIEPCPDCEAGKIYTASQVDGDD